MRILLETTKNCPFPQFDTKPVDYEDSQSYLYLKEPARRMEHETAARTCQSHDEPILSYKFDRSCGRKVGGRTEIKDVESNKEVQELGEFCVKEYNSREGNSGEQRRLDFRQVVKAQRQVVAGLKYYLKIAAAEDEDHHQFFDAVVLVKPWLGTKTLVDFSPSVSSFEFTS